MPMRVVHAKRHLRNARSAIVLRHSTPSVERVCAVPTPFGIPMLLQSCFMPLFTFALNESEDENRL